MRRRFSFLTIGASFFFAASCADNTVVQTGSVEVQWNQDNLADFQSAQTFSVITSDIIPPESLPDLDAGQRAFTDAVNELIVEAMQAEPVCLTLIDPEDVTDENQPDLWAANGVARDTNGGYVYQCVGGWWWGYWGWYWDSCAYWVPSYVEYDVGSLLIPVGLPIVGEAPPDLIFAGLAQSIVGSGGDPETKAREAVRLIFAQWPDKRSCP
jgi:hypothetical protein